MPSKLIAAATAAAAMLAVAVTSLALYRQCSLTTTSPIDIPSASDSPARLNEQFVSQRHGFSFRYPSQYEIIDTDDGEVIQLALPTEQRRNVLLTFSIVDEQTFERYRDAALSELSFSLDVQEQFLSALNRGHKPPETGHLYVSGVEPFVTHPDDGLNQLGTNAFGIAIQPDGLYFMQLRDGSVLKIEKSDHQSGDALIESVLDSLNPFLASSV